MQHGTGLAALLLVLFLAGCGGSSEPETSPPPPTGSGGNGDSGGGNNDDDDDDEDNNGDDGAGHGTDGNDDDDGADDGSDDDASDDGNVDDDTSVSDPFGLLAFNVAGSASLHALNEQVMVSSTSGDSAVMGAQRLERVAPNFVRSRLADDDDNSDDGDAPVVGSNLLAVDADGRLSLALDSPWPLNIAQTLMDSTGEYIYVAFSDPHDPYVDYSKGIAVLNCGIVRVSLADNDFECVAPGYEFSALNTNQWAQTLGGDFRGLRQDNEGTIYFSGMPFERQCNDDDPTRCHMTQRGNHTFIYKVAAGEEVPSLLTNDLATLLSFNVFADGTVVHHSIDYANEGGGYELAMYRDGETHRLDGTWRAQFFVSDDEGTVVYAYPQDNSVQYAQLDDDNRLQIASVSMDLFAGADEYSHNSGMLHRLITADDGRVYGLFTSSVLTAEPNAVEDPYTLSASLYQLLPYDAEPKVQVLLDYDQGAEEIIRSLPFLVNKGYVFYIEYEDVPFQGIAHKLKMRNLSSGESYTLIGADDPENLLLRVQNWQVSDNTLYFSANNLATSTSVLGEIDTLAVRELATRSEGENGDTGDASGAIRLIEMESATGAFLQVQDTEVLRPEQPKIDTGSQPSARFFASAENSGSVSIDFTKYMDRESVLANLRFIDEQGLDVDYIPVWMQQSLHLVADTSSNGTYDNVPGPMLPEQQYMVYLSDGVRDAWGWDLAGEETMVEVTMNPADGWIIRQRTDELSEQLGVSEGRYALFLGKRTDDEYQDAHYEVRADDRTALELPENFRIQFSTRQLWWGGARLAVVDDNDREWFEFMVNGEGVFYSYLNAEDNPNLESGRVFDHRLFTSTWRTYRFSAYGSTGVIEVSEDGENFETLETTRWFDGEHIPMPIDNMIERSEAPYRMVWKQHNRMVLDKFEVHALDEEGAFKHTLMEQDFNQLDSAALNEIFVEIPILDERD